MSEGRCIMCNASDATLWTLDTGGKVAVTYLCKRDAAPLVAVMDAAGAEPPSRQRSAVAQGLAPMPVHNRNHRRGRQMEPLDWTPPG